MTSATQHTPERAPESAPESAIPRAFWPRQKWLLLRRLAPSRSWGPLGGWAGVLFLKTLEMEHRTREARICRGGDGPPPLRPAPWEPWDWLYLSGALALLALLARGTP